MQELIEATGGCSIHIDETDRPAQKGAWAGEEYAQGRKPFRIVISACWTSRNSSGRSTTVYTKLRRRWA